MFYEGDLQSGIIKAVQESKLVACFVTGIYPPHSTLFHTDNVSSDDGEESTLWENDFLQEEAVSLLYLQIVEFKKLMYYCS
jgi:hypothetical protein